MASSAIGACPCAKVNSAAKLKFTDLNDPDKFFIVQRYIVFAKLFMKICAVAFCVNLITDRQTERLIDRETDRHRQTDRETDTDRQRDRQTERPVSYTHLTLPTKRIV